VRGRVPSYRIPQNHVGQYIQYLIDPGQANAGNGALAPVTGQTATANVVIGNDPRHPATNGTQWNFTFLKYNAGEVTTCPLNGNVMTGPFSGCYAFTYDDGQPKLAHVGPSHSPTNPGTIRAKQIWQAIVDGGATRIKGESPFKHFTPGGQAEVSRANHSQRPIVCSYYEPPTAWVILFIPAVVGATVVPGVLRIAAAKTMPQLDWNLIKAMREFR
jgi:hypothetical protein